ncbi:MAG: DNA-3-methyladenine glycosylase [Bacteroidales bacterium]|nr:DNA-3-methyladenine glycosylase [Bacteroidales bacterium]
MKIGQEFYLRENVVQIARDLLGKIIFTSIEGHITSGIISEVEAYAGIRDRASHAYNNRLTSRTEVMFGIGGTAYVYLCYGVHHLFNIVTNKVDQPDAILLRGIIPQKGIEIMEHRRGIKYRSKGFADGPGKVAQALGIKVIHTGVNLETGNIWLEDREIKIPEEDIYTGSRIGVEYAGEDAKLPYRFLVVGKIQA